MKHTLLSFLLVLAFADQLSSAAEPKVILGKPSPTSQVCEEALVHIREDDPASFRGMGKAGLERLVKAQQAFTTTSRNAAQNFTGMEAIFESDFVAIVAGQNVLHLGDSGGGKTGHLDWLFKDKLWSKQIHELTMGFEIFGGQTEEGLKLGVEQINRQGSIVNAKFANLDELSNANPALGSQLLAYLSPYERAYFENGVKMRGQTRTIFSTGNATRAQLLQRFANRQQFSGAALLARFAHKTWVPNWGTPDDLARVQESSAKRNHYWNVIRFGSPEEKAKARESLSRLDAQDVDWDIIEAFAVTAFQPDESLISAVRDLANAMKFKMDKIRILSEINYNLDPLRNSLPKEPTAEWTYRLFQDIMREIQASAALDYLRTQSESNLRKLNKPIILGPTSVWRAVFYSVTIGPGFLTFDPNLKMVIFNQTRTTRGEVSQLKREALIEQPRTVISRTEMEDMLNEQDYFNQELHKLLTDIKIGAKEVAAMHEMEDNVDFDLEARDFEVTMARLKAKNP